MEMEQRIYNRAKNCKSIDELMALAAENGIALTDEQAAEYYGKLQPPIGELSDDELDNVAGGGCGSSSGAMYHPGDHVMLKSNLFCNRPHSFYQGAQYRTENCRSPYWVITGNGTTSRSFDKVLLSMMGSPKEYIYPCRCPQCGIEGDVYEYEIKKV